MTAIADPMTDVAVPAAAVAHHEPARLAEWWRDTRVFAGRNLQHIRQIPEKLLDVTVQPLMFVLLFAYVMGGAIAVDGGNYREYLIGGILLQSIAFGMAGPAVSIATDLTEGVVDRFRSLPTSRAAYLSGHVLSELGGMVVAITILLGAGLLVGWRTHTDALHIATAVGLLLLFAFAMTWTGTLIGLSVRSPDAVMGIAFTSVFPLTFISNAFVPLETLPTVLQHVAEWNPVSVLVAAVRELFGNPVTPVPHETWPMENPVLAGFLYCLVILAVAVPLTLRKYRGRTSD